MTGEVIIILLIVFCTYIVIFRIDRLERALTSQEDHDAQIEKQIQFCLEEFQKGLNIRRAKLKEIEMILDPEKFAISVGTNSEDWKKELIAAGESLRGKSPTNYNDQKVSMTYYLAHALVENERARFDLAIKWDEWKLRKTELVGEYRKRDASILQIVRLEEELKDSEAEIKKLEETLSRSRADLEREYSTELQALQSGK